MTSLSGPTNSSLPLFQSEANISFQVLFEKRGPTITFNVHAKKIKDIWEVSIEATGEQLPANLREKKIYTLKPGEEVDEVDIGFINPDYVRQHLALYNLYNLYGKDHPLSKKFKKEGDVNLCALKLKADFLEVTSEAGLTLTPDFNSH